MLLKYGEQRRGVVLKCFYSFGQLREVATKLLEGRHFPVADSIPMSLVNPKQLDQEQNSIVLAQLMPLPPICECAIELLIKIRLNVVFHEII